MQKGIKKTSNLASKREQRNETTLLKQMRVCSKIAKINAIKRKTINNAHSKEVS